MADTIREQIISAYCTRLAAWTTANGYSHNCGVSAFRAVPHIDASALPACVLWPKNETVEQRYGQNVCKMSVELDVVVDPGEINPSIIQEQLLGDAIKIMADPAVEVSALIEDITYTGGGPASENKPEDQTTAIKASFEIQYETLTGNPYSQ